MDKKTLDLHMADSDAAHELYVKRGGEYGYMGGFLNRGPRRATDAKLFADCMAEVTGCKTLTERVKRYKSS